VNDEGSLFDVPPAAFGRYRVVQQLGAGTTGPMFRGEDPETLSPVAIKAFAAAADRASEFADLLATLVSRMPAHEVLTVPLAAGLDEGTPYLVTAFVEGDALQEALKDFGPAAIDDLVPRIRALAAGLDRAHDAGLLHGALHPNDILVSPETTHVTGVGVAALLARAGMAVPLRKPYAAPEVVKGETPGRAADQFALAALAFEWLFGRRITGPAQRPVEVRGLRGVDREALSRAFTRGLAPEAPDRFASCTMFAEGLADAVIPTLRLGMLAEDDDPVEPFVPEEPPPQLPPIEPFTDEPAMREPAARESFMDELSDRQAAGEPSMHDPDLREPEMRGGGSRFDTIDLPPRVEPAVASWQPAAASAPQKTAERFGGGMLIAALLVGMVAGFAAGYMARPRALQSGPPVTMNPEAAGADVASGDAVRPPDADAGADSAGTPAAAAGGNSSAVPGANRPAPTAAAPGTGAAPRKGPATAPRAAAPAAAARTEAPGRLLVRSTPSGATVQVDGVDRGVTPLALRDLELGSRQVSIARQGYVADNQRVVLTRERPSRSLEVRLAPTTTAAPPRPATPATLGRPAATTGALAVESRPSGATVTINGTPSGETPLVLEALAPGEYRVTIALAGYQPFTTTVRVVAGERVRAAASLSVQE
jgi:serine/threonine protein kinase